MRQQKIERPIHGGRLDSSAFFGETGDQLIGLGRLVICPNFGQYGSSDGGQSRAARQADHFGMGECGGCAVGMVGTGHGGYLKWARAGRIVVALPRRSYL